MGDAENDGDPGGDTTKDDTVTELGGYTGTESQNKCNDAEYNTS